MANNSTDGVAPAPFVSVMMGSASDWPTMRLAVQQLQRLQVHCEWKVTSAHRTPDATRDYVLDAERRGCHVFVAAAGMAAHLAGAVAAQTARPVVGVPMDASLQGLDALLSTVQMPAGVPVATTAIGKAGAVNAAWLAAQMLALQDTDLAERLRAERGAAAERVADQDRSVHRQDALTS